jgi:hypothetical protein
MRMIFSGRGALRQEWKRNRMKPKAKSARITAEDFFFMFITRIGETKRFHITDG